MIGIAVCIAGYFGINPPGFVAQVVAFAFGLAASSFFPIIVLGIFEKRTNREGAICGMSPVTALPSSISSTLSSWAVPPGSCTSAPRVSAL
jgi:Na+(H+)/acetate symporter ActP